MNHIAPNSQILTSNKRTFNILLVNSLVAAVTNAFTWFAIVFRAFLNTWSVIATGFIGGIFAVLNAVGAFIFGSIVDHNKKKNVMVYSSVISLVFYGIAALLYFVTPHELFTYVWSPMLWVFILAIMLGSIMGNLRYIALSVSVSMLFPVEEHAKANGKVGTMNGIAFAMTSIASWLVIGFLGMGWAMILAVGLTVLVLVHMLFIKLEEREPFNPHAQEEQQEAKAKKKTDVKWTIRIVRAIPGLVGLIFFTTFNNFLGGVFMSLMDAYGLSLVSVQTWGLLLGFLSLGFIGGGMFIAKFGLGKSPLRTMFLINVVTWTTCIFFTIQPWISLLIIGMLVWMTLFPFVEAAENTIMQKVVPYERLGRVIGFAHSIEGAASPITAFLIGPLTQLIFIPFMTTGRGVELIGSRFGTGPSRGIALVFTAAGIIGLIVTLIALASKPYKLLKKRYAEG